MQKFLLIDPEKCTGCRLCEMICSFQNERECNPAKSRIHVIKWEYAGIDIPLTCQQCEDPICERVCPVEAIFRDTRTSALTIDYNICIGCRMCLLACLFGGLSFDDDSKKVIKCELCGGDPLCAKLCPTKAIDYVPITTATLIKKRSSAQRLSELISKVVSPT